MRRLACRLRHTITRWWLSLEDPPAITAVQLAVYLLAGVGGVVALVQPPLSLIDAWGRPLTIAWACMLLVGGALAGAGCQRGLWWLETRAIWLLVLALQLRMLLVAVLHVTTAGNRATQLVELAMLSLMLLVRWLRIRDLPLNPMTRSCRASGADES